MAELNINITEENSLYNDVGQIINKSRQRLASLANTEICMMHWHIGKRIKEDVLYSQRAEYGKQILKNLSNKLSTQFGKGWSDRKLLHCIRCAYTFTEDEIIYAVSIQLTWTHLRSLMFIEERLKRQFYMEMTRIEHWNTRTLDHKIEELLYERTAYLEFHFVAEHLYELARCHALRGLGKPPRNVGCEAGGSRSEVLHSECPMYCARNH